MAVNIQSLTYLFDTKLMGNGPVSRMVNEVLGEELGLVCLVEALDQSGFCPAKIESPSCTQKTKKGKRLDAWVSGYSEGKRVLFQVEVKNWNSNSLGQDSFPWTDKDRSIAARMKNWGIVCKGDLQNVEICHEAVQKVLIPMRPDESFGEKADHPLVCIWLPLHPEGRQDFLFSAKLAKPQNGFSDVWFFSVSEFLAQRNKTKPLKLPQAEDKLKRLVELFGQP